LNKKTVIFIVSLSAFFVVVLSLVLWFVISEKNVKTNNLGVSESNAIILQSGKLPSGNDSTKVVDVDDANKKLKKVDVNCDAITYYYLLDYVTRTDVGGVFDYNYGGIRLIFDGKKYDVAQLLSAVQIYYYDKDLTSNKRVDISFSIHDDGYIEILDGNYRNAERVYVTVEWFYLNDDNTNNHSIVMIK